MSSTSEQKNKFIAAGVTVLFFLSLMGSAFLYNSNLTLTDVLNLEKLKSERLLSEKLQLDKEVASFKDEIHLMSGKNSELDALLADASAKLVERESSIAKLNKQAVTAQKLQKEVKDLRKFKSEFQQQLMSLQAANSSLLSENENLMKSNTGLKSENEDLKKKLSKAANFANNFKVEVLRRNPEKLTARAKRTHQIDISFEIPEVGAYLGERTAYFVVKGPDGKILTSTGEAKQVEVTIDNEKVTISPSAKQKIGAGKKVAVRFDPEETLTAGIYKVEVYTEEAFLGSNQFRLMK